MLRKTIVALIITFALGGSVLPASAFARASAFGGGRIARSGDVDHGDRVSELHRGLPGHGHVSKWDPWGHWGSYYGPMI